MHRFRTGRQFVDLFQLDIYIYMHTTKFVIRRPSAPQACRSWGVYSRNAVYKSWDRAFATEMEKAQD